MLLTTFPHDQDADGFAACGRWKNHMPVRLQRELPPALRLYMPAKPSGRVAWADATPEESGAGSLA